ncbi:hypothetical protein F8388_014389 [Cannabis sativa]|uniref:Ubiquitin-like protease family profile domain-containing protein n=1 Tax=Cannabis sativa TaxID=3483 RepID=A0A7J6FYL3_CANSA|nr:hypothetical protein G4B88_024789 [Cannabis sativa]KAF4375667.1 hypothetical protein F8388_014389 [Cannabis sativa]
MGYFHVHILKLRNITPTSVERLSLSLTDFFSGETTPEAVKFKIKGGSKPAGQPGLMGSSSSSAHENVSRVEFEEFKKCLSVVVSQQGILMKSVAEMNKKLDILIEPEQSQGGEENIDVDATIASAVKAVENLIGSSTHAPAPVETYEKTDLEMVVFQETPILRPQKRDRKKGAVLKSPFIELASGASKSGSSSVSPDDSVYKVVKYVRGLCPLDNKIGEPVDPQLEAEFVKWVDTGLRKHKSNTTTNVYCKGKDTIFLPFRFGVEDISNKMWFHNLAYPNCFLTNSCCSHIDIIFYYLRKKIMYSAEPKIKVTTTDCLFCSSITTLYEKFVEKNNDISVLSLSHNVAQYIQGGKILCATPWHLVDHVVMPINVKLQDHWICGRLNIVDRRISLYNSLRSGRYMTAAKEACKPFSVILPYYFSMLDFKGLRNEAKFSTMEPFPIVAVDGLPEQVTACHRIIAVKKHNNESEEQLGLTKSQNAQQASPNDVNVGACSTQQQPQPIPVKNSTSAINDAIKQERQQIIEILNKRKKQDSQQNYEIQMLRAQNEKRKLDMTLYIEEN